jgi:predicted ATPase
MGPDVSPDKMLLWRVRLFGGPILIDRFGNETRRFRSQKVKALLAYLALHLGNSCPREVMYEALWPEEEHEIVANRFRVALASLRRQLEPEGTVFGSVLDVSEPRMVRLRSETVWCDAIEYEALWQSGRQQEALLLAREPLLPDIYEDWALDVRMRYELQGENLIPPKDDRSQPAGLLPALSAPLPPPLSQPKLMPSSLPLFLTHFFGRIEERRKLTELIHTHRLVTITGIGGMGKTRLATETTRQLASDCFFIALGPVADPTELPAAFLKPFGVSPEPGSTLEEQLGRLLNRRGETLVVLDSVEHLIDAVAAIAIRLLAIVPDLHLLVTSRQILNIPGEAILALAPLEAPGAPGSVERLMEYPAISLFVDRAANARPDFTLTPRNMEAIIEICARLEGIPLALELAAARITSQTLGQIAHSLRRNATDLKSQQRGLSERHRSLRIVMETSLELLPEEVRSFFFALARLDGDWTSEMAREFTGCERCEEYLDLLAASSLVARREDERLGVMRFSLMETIRQLALLTDPSAPPLSAWETEDNLVMNGSFEVDRPSASWLAVAGGAFAYPFIVPAGWQGIGSVNVNTPSYTAFPNGIPDGSNTAVVGDQTQSGRLFQDVAATLTAGHIYTLTAWVGNRANYTGSGRVLLETVTSHILADSGRVAPEEGRFEKVTINFTAQADTIGLGEGLRVVLERPDGAQANFDSVCLTVSIPDEQDYAAPSV